MKVLFITSTIFISEPIGVMALIAVCKIAGHDAKLATIHRHQLDKVLDEFQPDVVAYSVMSSDSTDFIKLNEQVGNWAKKNSLPVKRIMGGPHPTYFPEIIEETELDAICIGEGDRAITAVLECFEHNRPIENIPNIATSMAETKTMKLELVENLDELPFIDRDAYFEAMPYYREIKLRSVLTSRGCPYRCTYCHNSGHNAMFRGHGKIVRRMSADRVIAELEHTVKNYAPVSMIRFGDDTFAHTIDDWLLEFLPKYKAKIGLPFYCLMRSNTLTEEMAKLLADHGCVSMSMAVESGNEHLRNDVLKRGLADEVVIRSFKYAEKYGLKTYGNTLLAIPGGALKEDFESLRFTRQRRLTVPTFGMFMPYPRTELTQYAIKTGVLDKDFDFTDYRSATPLNNYSEKDKQVLVNVAYLGSLYCDLPVALTKTMERLFRFKPNPLFKLLGNLHLTYKVGRHIFPGIYPKNPLFLLRLLIDSLKSLTSNDSREK